MIQFYKHKSDPRFFYINYTNGVYESYIAYWENEFLKFSTPNTKYIAVFNYENAYLVDKNFNQRSANLSKKYNHLFSDSIFIGLQGIQKTFFKIYTKLVASKNLTRHVLNDHSLFESQFNVTFEDFIIIASYDEEN